MAVSVYKSRGKQLSLLHEHMPFLEMSCDALKLCGVQVAAPDGMLTPPC